MTKRYSLLTIVAVLLLAGAAFASGTEEEPAPTPHAWRGSLHHGKASARINVQCSGAANGRVSFRLSGLQPDALYSFWWIEEGRRYGLGVAPYQARADAHGNLSYSRPLDECPAGGAALIIEVDRQRTPHRRVVVLRGSVAEAP